MQREICDRHIYKSQPCCKSKRNILTPQYPPRPFCPVTIPQHPTLHERAFQRVQCSFSDCMLSVYVLFDTGLAGLRPKPFYGLRWELIGGLDPCFIGAFGCLGILGMNQSINQSINPTLHAHNGSTIMRGSFMLSSGIYAFGHTVCFSA